MAARKVKVPIFGTIGKAIIIDSLATFGATLGTDVFTPDGEVGTPATVRAWLGVKTQTEVEEESGTQHHRLLEGLTLGNDHPQYPLKAGTETISGQWNFTQQVRAADGSAAAPSYSWEADRDNGLYRIGTNNVGMATGGALHWDINTTRTFQDVYSVVRNYTGVFIENPDYLNAGVQITTITGSDPLNNGIGNQLAFWEVGTGGAFTDRSYGFRIRHTGEVNMEGNLDFYRHQNDVNGVLFLRFTRDSSQIQFADGTASAPVVTNIGDENTGLYFPTADAIGLSTGGTVRVTLDTAAVTSTLPWRGPNGTNSAPALSFDNDTNTGAYRVGADNWGIATGGTLRFDISTTLVTSTLPIQLPTLDLGSTTDTTLSRASAGVLAVEGHNVPTVDQAQTISAQYTFTVAPLFANVLSPAQITAQADNYAPAGIGNAVHLRVNTDASRTMTGLTTGTLGRWLVLTNVGSFNLVLEHEGSSSTTTNRFWFEDATNVTLEPDQTRVLWYDSVTTRWRILMAGTGGGGGVSAVVAGDGIAVDATDPTNPIVSVDIDGLTEDVSPDGATDFVMTYDDSAGALRKVLLDNLPGGGGGSGMVVRYDVYTADDTWNKPAGFAFGVAIGIGQGGGGASGRYAVAGGGRVGGGGGGGGGRSVVYFSDSEAASSEAINVNGGGTGGAARTGGSDADGANGTAGEDTTFGSLLTAGGGGGGTGGTNSGNAAGGSGGSGNAGYGGAGGLGYATSVQTVPAVPTASTGAGGGGGGAGVTAANSHGTGTAGAANAAGTAAGGTAGASPPGGNGGAGGSNNDRNVGGGGGGSGSGSNVSTTVAGNGGAGGTFGGGGGGGAGGTRLASAGGSGAGGDGGSGFLIVISWMNVGAGTGIMDSVVAGDGIAVDSSDPINPVVSLDDSTGDYTWTGSQTFTSGIAFHIANNQPAFQLEEADQGTDAKNWRFRANGGTLRLETRLDDNSVGTDAWLAQRSGSAVTNVSLGNSTDNPTITIPGTGALLKAPGASLSAVDYSFSGDPNTGMYRVGADNLGLVAGGASFLLGGSTYMEVPQARRYTGIISPAQITGNTNNYNPTGLSTCSVMRLSTDASRNLTGIVAQSSGTRITICNVGAQDLVLVHNATSSAANQFLCPGSANYTLNANDAVDILYDSTSSRWRVLAAA